jgi:serine protease Do
MDEHNDTDTRMRRAPPARRAVVLASVVAFTAVAGGFGAHLAPRDWRASYQSHGETIGQTNSGPAGFADTVDAVKPAVIGVQTQTKRAESSEFGAPLSSSRPDRTVTAQGSGFFISADGYAVTNNHVIEGSTTAEIQTDDHKIYTAKVVGTDPTSDLALLKVDGRDDFAYVKLADKMPRIGDWVLAIGNPFGLGGTVTAGIVSARERNIGGVSSDNLLQIDAPINRGDSGGPTFDLDGKVVGVNMMIYSPSGGSIGIAFAIPAETVRTVMPQLKEKGAVVRGWLGVQIQPVSADIADVLGLKQPQGALVAEAQPDGPAAKAGITSGDIVASVNDVAIIDATGLSKTISGIAPGTSVKLGVLRQGEEKSMTVVLGELPGKRQTAASKQQESKEQATPGRDAARDLGLKLAPARTIPGLGEEEGVIVTGIDPTGLGAHQGFELGDIILEVSGKAVKTPAEIHSALGGARSEGKHAILMRVRSGETMRFVAVPTG